MYRVLIVDDEPIIRNGIEAFIGWEKEGLSVEAICSNGADALIVLEDRPADILITDIKMPLVDGIQLMSQALKLYPWIKVILLSSYSDFEYVREGLKLGAVDYLLKAALKPDDLLVVLRRCVSMLEEERRKEAEFRQGAVYRERKYLEQEMKRLIVQEQAALSLTGRVPAWLEQRYACAYLILDRADEWRENNGCLYVQLLLEELQELFYKQMDEGAAMLMGESGMFLVFPDDIGDAEPRLRRWKESVERELGISTSIGFRVEQGIGQVRKGVACSRSACQRRFFEGLGGVHDWVGPDSIQDAPLTSSTASVGWEPPDWEPLLEMIRNGDRITSALKLAIKRWKGGGLDPERVKQEACGLLSDAYRLKEVAGSLLPERLDLLQRSETLDQMAALLASELEEIEKIFIQSLADKGDGGQKIMKALEYIADHYTESLTLQSVADTVYISRTYFSILFKKQTGRNFSDYLIDLRIREAKRLLVEEDERMYDVAEASGFNDVKYFSKLFKKMTGLTPLEYREKFKNTGSGRSEKLPEPK